MRHTKEQVKNNNQTTQGTSPRNTFGCLVIAKERVKDKNNPDEFADNILGADSSKKEDLAKIIKEVNGLSQYLFDENTRAELQTDIARAKAVAEHIEIRIKNNFKQTKAKEQEESLPPNIIRIETEDESEDFIEIKLPLIYDPPLQDMSAMFIPALRGIGSIIKGTKGVANLGRSLTREEVLEIVNKLPKGLRNDGKINERIRLVKSKKELDELWEKLTKNF